MLSCVRATGFVNDTGNAILVAHARPDSRAALPHAGVHDGQHEPPSGLQRSFLAKDLKITPYGPCECLICLGRETNPASKFGDWAYSPTGPNSYPARSRPLWPEEPGSPSRESRLKPGRGVALGMAPNRLIWQDALDTSRLVD